MIRVAWIRRYILDPHLAGLGGFPWAFLAVLLACFLRTILAPWVSGAPFLTFFPAIQIASMFLGWRWGAFVLASSAAIANFMFQPPAMSFSFGTSEIVSGAAFLAAGSLMIWTSSFLRRAVFRLDEAAERERELKLELSHRVNNSLTVIQGLAMQTSRVHPEPEAFYEAFSGRLYALSEANKILMSGSTEVSQLPGLASAATKPFIAQQLTLNGPRCGVPLASSVPLVMALHELGTNATKYGALSVPSGRVELNWVLDEETCHLSWREIDGPEVKSPKRRGLGTRLLKPQPGIDDIQIAFEPTGVWCEIKIRGCQAL